MAMTPEIRLTTELATVSLRMLLQKSLSHYLHTQGAKARFDREAVPLSSLQVSGELDYQYESAIAHALAATDALEAVTLAPQLAADLMAAFAEADQATSLVGAIATGLRVHATPQGWLTLTVLPAGLTAWRQHWLQAPLPALAGAGAISAMPDLKGHWPLCDRLQLSLPMVLQWAHVRCQTWQQQLADHRATKPPLTAPWVTDEVLPGRLRVDLLPAVIQALDQMAARAGETPACIRQGYVLAEQVYRYDAHRAQWRSLTDERMESAATLAATQKVLAWVLAIGFNILPLGHL